MFSLFYANLTFPPAGGAAPPPCWPQIPACVTAEAAAATPAASTPHYLLSTNKRSPNKSCAACVAESCCRFLPPLKRSSYLAAARLRGTSPPCWWTQIWSAVMQNSSDEVSTWPIRAVAMIFLKRCRQFVFFFSKSSYSDMSDWWSCIFCSILSSIFYKLSFESYLLRCGNRSSSLDSFRF